MLELSPSARGQLTMDESRRDFLKSSGLAALGVGGGFPLLTSACEAVAQADRPMEATPQTQLGLVVDLEKCRGEEVRAACTRACHLTHNVPDIPDPADAVKWIWTERFEDVFPDQVHQHTAPSLLESPVLVLCNHCDNPPCVRVCPTGATWKRESDGIVMMDQHRCIGCRYCIAACPYGSRSFNWRDPRDFIEKDEEGGFVSDFPTRTRGVVEKCNFCAERLREGLRPACVEAVNEIDGADGALTFGEVSDPDSDVSRILNSTHTISRRVGLGTGPNVYYIV